MNDGTPVVFTPEMLVAFMRKKLKENKSRQASYWKLLWYLHFVVIYFIILLMQKDTSSAYEVKTVIQDSLFSPDTQTTDEEGNVVEMFDNVDHFYTWLDEAVITPNFVDEQVI